MKSLVLASLNHHLENLESAQEEEDDSRYQTSVDMVHWLASEKTHLDFFFS